MVNGEKKCQNVLKKNTLGRSKYLQSKFVEAEVDEVLDARQDTVIQVLPCDALEDDAEGRGLELVMETEVELVPMDRCLKHQQPEHHQVVLQHRTQRSRGRGLDCGTTSISEVLCDPGLHLTQPRLLVTKLFVVSLTVCALQSKSG